MENNKNLLVFCSLIGVLIFAYYFLPVNFVEGDDVTVSATVSQTVSCTPSTTTTAFGTLTTSVITTSTPDVTITMSCNHAGGGTLKVKDTGDFSTNPCLHSTTSADEIGSADSAYANTSTLAIGTEGYGIQATTTAAGSGGTLTIAARYNYSATSTVGGLEVTDVDISSSSIPISGRETVIKHKAAISGLTKAATDYADVLTYSCTGN